MLVVPYNQQTIPAAARIYATGISNQAAHLLASVAPSGTRAPTIVSHTPTMWTSSPDLGGACKPRARWLGRHGLPVTHARVAESVRLIHIGLDVHGYTSAFAAGSGY